MKIKKAFKIINENINESDFTGVIDVESIREAEDILNVRFPQSYKDFLK
ncbi:hypothetical protein [Flavobacterium sp.]